MPDLYIIAGPNGAGKTTAAQIIFPETLGITEFVNADEIARGISPFNWEGVAFHIAKQRVAKRVSEGGHNIVDNIIERRYFRGLKNLNAYVSLADDWYCFDNSNGEYKPIAKNVKDEKTIVNFEVWKLIQN